MAYILFFYCLSFSFFFFFFFFAVSDGPDHPAHVHMLMRTFAIYFGNHWVVEYIFVQQTAYSESAVSPADLDLYYSQMSKRTFSHDTTQT